MDPDSQIVVGRVVVLCINMDPRAISTIALAEDCIWETRLQGTQVVQGVVLIVHPLQEALS